MPAAEFSEFSYGYAVIRHAEDLLVAMGAALACAPTLPSLLKENTVGYDAQLATVDFAVFLQFKRSYFVSRRHPRGMCGYVNGEPHCTWAHWNGEHYRFGVDTRSNQFTIMRGYETDIALGYRAGLSVYVAPAFHIQKELNDAYMRGTVLQRSAGVAPSTFDAVAPGSHHFSFDSAMTDAVVMSEPIPTVAKNLADQISSAMDHRALGQPARRESLTLAGLASWASNQPLEFPHRSDFDRGNAIQTLAFLSEFAGLLGGAFVLLGRVSENPD